MSRMSAITEKYAHWIACGGAAAAHHFIWPAVFPNDAKEMIGAVLNISGIAVGFLATGQALLCSLNDNAVVQTLKELNRLPDMLRFFTVAIHWCLVLASVSLISYWVDISNLKRFELLFSLWLGLFAGAFVSTLRILALFSKVLHGKKR